VPALADVGPQPDAGEQGLDPGCRFSNGTSARPAELTDVATGRTFRLADLAGTTVIIETMAIWCSNCLAQQRHVYDALVDLAPAHVAYVVIDVDPNETEAALAQYRDRNGFTGTYVVATRDLARALASEFGDQVLNPPSTPMLLIGSDGRVTLTDYGSKSPERIVELAPCR
jgi:thiol-disulfide isomerase/thioredoxin